MSTHQNRTGLLQSLHAVQERFGYIPTQVAQSLADEFNISRAEIEGVIGFYHDFKASQQGRRRLRICNAESCQAMGSVELVKHICKLLNVELGNTTDDGEFSVEEVYCLGNCACSPALMIDNDLHGRVTVEYANQLFHESVSK